MGGEKRGGGLRRMKAREVGRDSADSGSTKTVAERGKNLGKKTHG
jgi:hypothetical protein